MPVVYIGIGSNLGDRRGNCLRAIELLEERGVTVLKRSSMHETTPWGVKDQPLFINMAVEAATDLPPRELLSLLKLIENNMGREHAMRWGPRIIDLDILLYGDIVLKDKDIEIPHPFMHEREFVLDPLSEIAAGLLHPVLNRTIIELRDQRKKRS